MTDQSTLHRTPLYALHEELGAKMVPFAGYAMPVQYRAGVFKEHLHTRTKAGLFDVSHMGQVMLRPRTGQYEDAALAFESLMPVDVLGLKEGRQRYGFFTNAQGGILDDLMFANRGDHIFVVVNAACKEADVAYMQGALCASCRVEPLEGRALLALQGPLAEAALSLFAPEAAHMHFMDVREVTLLGHRAIVSRSGYSGEDGYEISLPAELAEDFARELLALEGVEPVGLGARDSLRLEAGLCLYGNDITAETTPVEASLKWAMQKVRRRGGSREGGFPGADIILEQLENGAARRRVGISPGGRAPMRAGTALFADEGLSEPIGSVTSGGFGPSVEVPVSMGYVIAEHARIGTKIFADLRGKAVPASVVDLPFITPSYKR